MELFIIRHGIAQERGSVNDADRALTSIGRRKTAVVAEGLSKLGCRPACIGTSSLRRAEETARIMAEVLCPDVPVDICEFLEPGGDPVDLVDWLREHGEESVMIVGHMPDVAEAASVFLAGRNDVEMVFKKAAVCCIEFDGVPAAGSGRLRWLMQPRQLRHSSQA